MAGSEDPRLDRVIAALNTLEAAQRSQAGTIERLQTELAAAMRDAAEAREDAAFAKAETATYQAELASTARRNELERIGERLDATDAALVDLHRRDSQASSVRDQVVKLSRALSKAASISDLGEVSQRMEQIDDRLQVRLDHLSSDVVATARAGADVQEALAQLSSDSSDVSQRLDERLRSLEAGRDELVERFERVVLTAEAEIDKVAGHLDRRITDLAARFENHESRFAELTDPEPALEELAAGTADLNRSVRVLRSTIESDRTVLRDLEQRVFGPDGLGARLMQLAQVVIEQNEREPIPTPTDPALLAFQGRIEDLVTRVEALSSLRTRVEVMEKRYER